MNETNDRYRAEHAPMPPSFPKPTPPGITTPTIAEINAAATTTGEAPDNERDATASLRDAAMSKGCVRLVRAVAFELRSVARYHQPVTKDEVRVRSAFMLKLADNLEWALNGIPTPPATPAAVTQAAIGAGFSAFYARYSGPINLESANAALTAAIVAALAATKEAT